MKKFKILIHGGALSNNEGAAAMTIVAAEIIQKIVENPEITISSIYLDEDLKRNMQFNYRVIQKRDIIYLSLNPISFFSQFVKIYNRYLMLMEYYRTDLIIDVSGDGYSDDYGFLASFLWLKELIYPILFNKPIIIFPQSLGPFKSQFTYNFAKFILNRCKVVIARETITKKTIDDMKLKTRVELIDDSAFLLKPVSKDKLNDITKLVNRNKDKMLIGLSLSQSIANFSKASTTEKYKEYLQKMTNLVNYLTKLGQVVLISHVGGNANKTNDDLIISEIIYNNANDKDRIIFLKKRYLPAEWKRIISMCDIFIGARMHANIAALSTNVPTIAIAYSHKFYGIMERYGQSEYVCDIMKLSEDELKEKVNELLQSRKNIIKSLKSKNKEIEKNENILSSYILEALENKKQPYICPKTATANN